jgi:hypothetical protein
MTVMSRAAFDEAIGRAGLPLDEDTKADIHEAFGLLEKLIDRVNAPQAREAEPAVMFRP